MTKNKILIIILVIITIFLICLHIYNHKTLRDEYGSSNTSQYESQNDYSKDKDNNNENKSYATGEQTEEDVISILDNSAYIAKTGEYTNVFIFFKNEDDPNTMLVKLRTFDEADYDDLIISICSFEDEGKTIVFNSDTDSKNKLSFDCTNHDKYIIIDNIKYEKTDITKYVD